MTYAGTGGDTERSMYVIATTLLRSRGRILRWTVAGALLALATVIAKPAVYKASASFAPQGNDPGRSGLASLAGQFGVALPTTSQTLSPDYYARLLKSRSLLRRVVADTFVVQEEGGKRIPFTALFKLNQATAQLREDAGVTLLERIVNASVAKTTGIVEVSVATRWRSVSIAIVQALVSGVNEFNQNTRQSQASEERKFVEGRMAIANAELRAAEDRMESFLRSNRQYTNSPDLTLQRERLQRDVIQRQQVYSQLAQSYEEVRLREVRDTPLITIIEPPSAPALPEPRGRSKVAFLGIMLGGFIGVMLVIFSDLRERRRLAGESDADELVAALQAARGDLARPFRWVAGRTRR
jgi:uncharacterized protein involved in exopolysaccharide biosynthesis